MSDSQKEAGGLKPMCVDEDAPSFAEISEVKSVCHSVEPSCSEVADRSQNISPIPPEEAIETFPHAREDSDLLHTSVHDKRSDEFWKVKIHHLPVLKTMWLFKTKTKTRRFSKDFCDKLEFAFKIQSPSFSLSPAFTVCLNTMSLLLVPKKEVVNDNNNNNMAPDSDPQFCATIERHSTTDTSVRIMKQLTDEEFERLRDRAFALNASVFRDKYHESGEIIRICAPESVSDILVKMVQTSGPVIVINHAQPVDEKIASRAQNLVN